MQEVDTLLLSKDRSLEDASRQLASSKGESEASLNNLLEEVRKPDSERQSSSSKQLPQIQKKGVDLRILEMLKQGGDKERIVKADGIILSKTLRTNLLQCFKTSPDYPTEAESAKKQTKEKTSGSLEEPPEQPPEPRTKPRTEVKPTNLNKSTPLPKKLIIHGEKPKFSLASIAPPTNQAPAISAISKFSPKHGLFASKHQSQPVIIVTEPSSNSKFRAQNGQSSRDQAPSPSISTANFHKASSSERRMSLKTGVTSSNALHSTFRVMSPQQNVSDLTGWGTDPTDSNSMTGFQNG